MRSTFDSRLYQTRKLLPASLPEIALEASLLKAHLPRVETAESTRAGPLHSLIQMA